MFNNHLHICVVRLKNNQVNSFGNSQKKIKIMEFKRKKLIKDVVIVEINN